MEEGTPGNAAGGERGGGAVGPWRIVFTWRGWRLVLSLFGRLVRLGGKKGDGVAE